MGQTHVGLNFTLATDNTCETFGRSLDLTETIYYMYKMEIMMPFYGVVEKINGIID